MRISDWSSDVCSSDLLVAGVVDDDSVGIGGAHGAGNDRERPLAQRILQDSIMFDRDQIGAEKAFQASAFDGANEKIAHFDLEIMIAGDVGPERSEEHTSEPQSLMRISYAVFCLKKKKSNKYHEQVNNSQRE